MSANGGETGSAGTVFSTGHCVQGVAFTANRRSDEVVQAGRREMQRRGWRLFCILRRVREKELFAASR